VRDGRFFSVDPVVSYVAIAYSMPDEAFYQKTFGCAFVLFSRDFQTLNRDCIASFLCRVLFFFTVVELLIYLSKIYKCKIKNILKKKT